MSTCSSPPARWSPWTGGWSRRERSTRQPSPVNPCRSRPAGNDVRSGVVNAGPPVELVTTTTAETSTYAALVRLVAEAQATSAPFVRVADRWAVAFVPLTLVLAGAAWWAAGDPVRAVAVLVVATPCPLLLAAPIAIVSGLSRAARLGVVVKGGGALERLAAGRVGVINKTGTLTRGRPTLTGGPHHRLGRSGPALRLAASVDQVSCTCWPARSSRRRWRVVSSRVPRGVQVPGQGVAGTSAGAYASARPDWITGPPPGPLGAPGAPACGPGRLNERARRDRRRARGGASAARPDPPGRAAHGAALRAAGIERVVLATGDRADVADVVGRIVGVDTVLADCEPADGLAALGREARRGPHRDGRRRDQRRARAGGRRRRRGAGRTRCTASSGPRTSCSPSTASTPSPTRCWSPAGRAGSRWRRSPSAWGLPGRDGCRGARLAGTRHRRRAPEVIDLLAICGRAARRAADPPAHRSGLPEDARRTLAALHAPARRPGAPWSSGSRASRTRCPPRARTSPRPARCSTRSRTTSCRTSGRTRSSSSRWSRAPWAATRRSPRSAAPTRRSSTR